jgi:peptidoglycan/LPS O-acetylase OafA/YrhL
VPVPEQQQPRPYYPALTGLRFIAASMVFILHNHDAIARNLPGFLVEFLQEFHTGVAIFFVLSGFLIASHYQANPIRTVGDYFAYVVIRLARIYPLYILVFLELHSRWLFTVPDFVLHATLLKGFFSTIHNMGVKQAWSLTVELTFYILAPLLFWLNKVWSILVVYVATLLAGLLLTGIGFWLYQAGYNSYGFMPDLKFTFWNTFFGRATEFFAGMLLSFILQKYPAVKPSWLRWPVSYTYAGLLGFALTLYVISILSTATFSGTGSWGGMLLHNFLLPVSIFFILYGLMHERNLLNRLLSARFVLLLGNASYAFYLVHMGKTDHFIQTHLTDQVVVKYLLLWALSILLYLVWEKPIYKWVKNQVRPR